MHGAVFKSFQHNSAFTQDILIPHPLAYVNQNDCRWMGQFGFAAQMPSEHSELRDILISQRIPSVPIAVCETLINAYCPEMIKARCRIGLGDHTCLIRLYLGKRRPHRMNGLQGRASRPSSFFSLTNFKMYFDQMISLELHVSFVAKTMADTLAVMHWKAHVDARDVEFVLGGVPGDNKDFLPPSDEEWQNLSMWKLQQGQWSHTSSSSSVINLQGQRVCMWLFDFNQCQTMAMDECGVKQAVDAFFTNDPYYPRPPKSLRKPRSHILSDANGPAELLSMHEDDKNWFIFRDRYLATSAELLKDVAEHQHLAQTFMDNVIDEQMKRFAKRDIC